MKKPEKIGEASPIVKPHLLTTTNNLTDSVSEEQVSLRHLAQKLIKPDKKYLAITIKKVEYTHEELYTFFCSLPYLSAFLIAKESAKTAGIHFHGFFEISGDYDCGSQFRTMKNDWKAKMPQFQTTFALQVSLVEKFEYASYCCKEGAILYKNISGELISLLKEFSYPKYSKDKFAVEWDQILYNKDLIPQKKLELYILLKQKYRQKVDSRQVESIYLNLRLLNQADRITFINDCVQRVDERFIPYKDRFGLGFG